MIKSSIIKLILIIILNICFVCVWAYKEKLRKVNIFKNEKLSIFWAFNVLYVIVTAKAFEKVLDVTLGFSYGIKYIEKSVETPFFKIDYFGIKTLDDIAGFILDTNSLIGLFIGVTALMIPIYLYIIGFKSKSKRQLLLMLTKKGDMFYLSFFIYVMLFFKVEKIFLIGAIGYLIYLLMEAVKWIMKIENSLYSFEGLDKILKLQEEEEIVELYNATLNELYQGVKDSNASATDENKKLLLLLLRDNIIKIENTKNKENTKNLIRTLYDIYDIAIKNQDDDIFRTISYLYVNIAKYYRKKNDKEHFYWALCGMGKVYDYSYKNGTDKFESAVVSGFRYNSFGIYEEYKENFEEGIEWYSQMFEVITEGIKKTVINDDLYFFQQFTYLIGHQFKHKKEIKKDYKLLERSVYFGVLMYLKEEKRKLKDNENKFKKMDEYIEFIEKLLSNNNIIDLIELYQFIGEEIYGWNEEYRDRLNWDKIFQPKIELVKTRAHSVRTDGEKNKLFFELLGKIKYSKDAKEALLNEEELKKYLNFPFKSNRKIKKDTEKSIKRVNNFKEMASGLLNDLEKYKNEEKINILEEDYNKVKGLLIEFKNITEQKKKNKIREAEISTNKIKIMKEILKKILSDSKILKMLEGFNKYKLMLKEKNDEIQCLGINEYMEKEFFTEIYIGNEIEFIVEPLGEDQNEGVERIIINSLDERNIESEETIEKVLEKIKGIIIKSDLDKKYFEKYGEILEGVYKYNGVESPIYNLDSDKEGIYILDSDDIKEFVHYDPNLEIKDSKDVEKEFDDLIGYASLKITDTRKILEKREEEVLKYECLQDYGSDKEKIKHFKELVLVEFSQKGELKLKEGAKVYKVEFNEFQ